MCTKADGLCEQRRCVCIFIGVLLSAIVAFLNVCIKKTLTLSFGLVADDFDDEMLIFSLSLSLSSLSPIWNFLGVRERKVFFGCLIFYNHLPWGELGIFLVNFSPTLVWDAEIFPLL